MRQNRSNHRNSVAAGRTSFIDVPVQSDEQSRQSWLNSVSPSPQHSDTSLSSVLSKNKSSVKVCTLNPQRVIIPAKCPNFSSSLDRCRMRQRPLRPFRCYRVMTKLCK